MNQPIDTIAETLKLVSDKTRLTILALLKEREMCVCDIVTILETTQPNVSQHLRKLKVGDLVNETRRAQWIYYSLNTDDKPYLHGILEVLPSMKHELQKLSPDCCS
ncbi:ArsR/SmtB family transcription factor [Paenibacillus harenae]|uniref:ArsR family transcriptional regulator n=1 Tax=Paenibacillus harenae TaxID=306543 RepID=A0ABT9U951_PAEHA|nr:metalloregulator ArsR/SmtB family transcription factor [Paenibacillus harenae]MDQ0063790.1 ArsR family transcriptional regulator [Paenibacillus harenae]MDQ0116161.1 ArsR family transcriptional regulator [Paenibacillus harenae]